MRKPANDHAYDNCNGRQCGNEPYIAQLEKRNEALVKALEDAGNVIHSEFCSVGISGEHNEECVRVTDALAANRSRTNESEG